VTTPFEKTFQLMNSNTHLKSREALPLNNCRW